MVFLALLAGGSGACVEHSDLPPGAAHRLAGIWSGQLSAGDTSAFVVAWVEPGSGAIAGVAEMSTEYPPEVAAVGRNQACDASAELTDLDVIHIRWGDEDDDAADLPIRYDPTTETMAGELNVSTPRGDLEIAGTLSRISWLATREGPETIYLHGHGSGTTMVPEVPLGCFPGPPPECYDGADNDGDGLVDAADPACLDRVSSWNDTGYASAFLLMGNDEAADPECFDGEDNDGDGRIDGDDPTCDGDLGDSERGEDPDCADGWDNDLDGLTDLEDPGCSGDPTRRREAPWSCEDGLDNDGDHFIDALDPDCVYINGEIAGLGPCANRWDDDGNGLVDLDDPSCMGDPDHPFEGAYTECNDFLDNDGDGLVDLEESSCEEYFPFLENGDALGWWFQDCDDGVDNDGDGAVDGDDPQCVVVGTGWEFDDPPPWSVAQIPGHCTNKLDDDGDGLVDGADPGCAVPIGLSIQHSGSPLQQSPFESTPPCLDGLDNDGDGLTDHADPQCDHPFALGEEWTCSNGHDDDGDGRIDDEDPSCLGGPDGDEDAPECSDGIDNDDDGLIDTDDPGCLSPRDDREVPACADRLDNDGDHLYDLADPGCVDSSDDSEL